MEKEYKINKPFNLVDIFKKNPCANEYAALLEERADEGYSIRHRIETFRSIKNSEVLMRNLRWLEEKGFICEDRWGYLDYEKPILAYGGPDPEYILIPVIEKGDYTVKGYNWFKVKDFGYNSCCTFDTIDDALRCYGRKYKNVELCTTNI